MKYKNLFVPAVLLTSSLTNIGCMSSVSTHARSIYRDAATALSTNTNVTPETEALYSQVGKQDQLTVQKLRHEIEVTQQERILANLVADRDDLQQRRSKINAKRLSVLAKEKNHKFNLAKLEAIDKNKLGDKITNIELIVDEHVDVLEQQKHRLQLDSEVAILDVQINNLQKDIEAKQLEIDQLENDTTARR
jgi:hypothetical protein